MDGAGIVQGLYLGCTSSECRVRRLGGKGATGRKMEAGKTRHAHIHAHTQTRAQLCESLAQYLTAIWRCVQLGGQHVRLVPQLRPEMGTLQAMEV